MFKDGLHIILLFPYIVEFPYGISFYFEYITYNIDVWVQQDKYKM